MIIRNITKRMKEDGLPLDLDKACRDILAALQDDARLSFNQLAKRVGLSPPAVAERVRRMEETGVIRGYRIEVSRASLGWPVTAMVRLSCPAQQDRGVVNLARDLPEILECFHVSGEDCFVLKVAAGSIGHLEDVVERLRQFGNVITSIVFSAAVEGKPLAPVDERIP